MLEYEEMAENYDKLEQQSGGITEIRQQQALFDSILAQKNDE